MRIQLPAHAQNNRNWLPKNSEEIYVHVCGVVPKPQVCDLKKNQQV